MAYQYISERRQCSFITGGAKNTVCRSSHLEDRSGGALKNGTYSVANFMVTMGGVKGSTPKISGVLSHRSLMANLCHEKPDND